MNKLFSTIMWSLACNVQATDLFKTSQDIALRAPSVPLITSDTYLAYLVSLQRTERREQPNTGQPPPILYWERSGWTGKYNRFMGKDKLNLETILTDDKHR